MVNAWSLAASILDGTFEEDYPLMEKEKYIYESPDGGKTVTRRKIIDTSVGSDSTAFQHGIDGHYEYYNDDDGLDYETDYYSDIDDMYSHHLTNANSFYNDGWTRQFHQEQLEKLQEPMAHYFKYHEEEILKDIQEYVSGTYQGHYTGKSHEYRNVQTIDLMASKELAAAFCQANILKYGSRYGNKDGKNKKDLMKVIHYAMLLLHFDNHYGEPSMPSGNFEQMP